MPCEVLVADPPWQFEQRTNRLHGTTENHYPVLTVAEICAFPLPVLARDATLFLWRVASMQDEALDVVRAWGFKTKSEIVWRKLTKNGKRHFGMGRRVRMEHEICLICTRGAPTVLDASVRSVFDAADPGLDDEIPSVFEAKTGRHSQKPPEFFEIVERLTGWPAPSTHVELFAREQRDGWACYGNELATPHPPQQSTREDNL